MAQVFNTGIISAKIEFTKPTDIDWVEPDGTQTRLGSMVLQTLNAKHKRAVINQTVTFDITDEAAFGRFSSYLITSPNFTWHLRSEDLRVQALKFPVSKGITFDKSLTLNGASSGYIVHDPRLTSDQVLITLMGMLF